MVRKLLIILLLLVLAIVLVGSPLAIAIILANKMNVVAILPEKTKESKLIRIIDEEAGVVCYIVQNDTADFYSGLQCMSIDNTYFRKQKGMF